MHPRRESSLDAYFSHSPQLPDEDLSALSEALFSVRGKVVSRIGVTKKLKVRKPPEPKEDEVTRVTAEHRLIAVKKEQEMLAERLAYVSSQVATLTHQTQSLVSRKRQSAFDQRSLSCHCRSPSAPIEATTDTKRSESVLPRVAMIRRLRLEKEERLKRLRSLQEVRERFEREKLVEREKEEEEERQRERERMMDVLSKRHESLAQRQETRLRMKSETDRRLRAIKSQKPLHAVLEERFQKKFIEPEQKRFADFLSHKHPSESFDSIQQHAKEAKEREEQLTKTKIDSRAKRIRELQEWQKSTKLYRPRLLDVIQAEDSAAKLAQIQKEDHMSHLRIKKQQYGEVVRQLFKPSPSRLKRIEMELVKAKNSSPKIVKVYTPVPIAVPRVSLRKKRISQSSETLTESLPVQRKDYLKDLKQQRENSIGKASGGRLRSRWQSLLQEEIDTSRLSEIQKEAQRLEILARSHEIEIDGSDFATSVAHREVVSSIYLDSIRGKLAVIEKLSS